MIAYGSDADGIQVSREGARITLTVEVPDIEYDACVEKNMDLERAHSVAVALLTAVHDAEQEGWS